MLQILLLHLTKDDEASATTEGIMSLKLEPIGVIPETTARVAKAAFPMGNLWIHMRDALGIVYQDASFAALFPPIGQPALAPWRLALITLMQFAEGLPDRQAADAVRSRIDWKYALGLELDDNGFDFSVLSEFRTRLIAGHAESVLFDSFLTSCKQHGWLKAGGRQRTDATHVLAAIRAVNRIVCLGETLRAALNSLALVVPDWLQAFVPAEWYERYSHRIEDYGLPKEKTKRIAVAELMGADGAALLEAIFNSPAYAILRHMPAIQTLRQVWVQQFETVDGTLRFRSDENIPPTATMICSPYDVDATYGRKLTTWWVGYKVHLTETCDEEYPHLITHVETSRAGNGDVDVTARIHQALKEQDLLPSEHMMDTNYAESKQFIESRQQYGVNLIAPTRADNGWQAKAGQGFDASSFQIDWETQHAMCPAGKTSLSWSPAIDPYESHVIKIKFSMKDCTPCPLKVNCTQAQRRTITIRTKEQHQALQEARARQKDATFWEKYQVRAGIEGTISQGVRAVGLRRSRYRGMAKTHLQHLISATAINMKRVVAWLDEIPLAKTRTSHFAALAV